MMTAQELIALREDIRREGLPGVCAEGKTDNGLRLGGNVANKNRTVDVVARHGDYSVERVTLTGGRDDPEPYYFVDVFGPAFDSAGQGTGDRTCTNIYMGTDDKIARYISKRLAKMCRRLYRGQQ